MQKMLSKLKVDNANNESLTRHNKLIIGVNDMATLYPNIASEWNYEKNSNLMRRGKNVNSPSMFLPGSGQKVFWKGKCGHEWDATIIDRCKHNNPCPYCNNTRLLVGFNDLMTRYPEIAAQWHPTKNAGHKPNEYLFGSGVSVYWLCPEDHEYKESISHRVYMNTGCPYCSGHKVLAGYNDLSTTNPEIAAEWDYEKNKGLIYKGILIEKPDSVSRGSHAKVYWRCLQGHSWQTSPNQRTYYKSGCPVCDNVICVSGVNDLATLYPEIAEEWHLTKNGGVLPSEVLAGSHESYWWLGKCGHEWHSTIKQRVKRDAKCPYCAHKRILTGFNDLATLYPELMSEWDYELNKVNPSTISAMSHDKYMWICANGHSWEATPAHRTKDGSGCPYCAGKKVIAGVNDLETRFPEIAKELHPTKNGELGARDIMPGSMAKVWWLCPKGHEYQATPNSRTSINVKKNRLGNKCPECSRERKSSFPEQAIYYYVKQAFPDAVNGSHVLGKLELDVYIPSVRTGIEFDGYVYHKNTDRDRRKNELCAENDIKLFRIRENGASGADDCQCYYYQSGDWNALEGIIQSVLKEMFVKKYISIDICRDEQKIYESYIYQEKQNSVEALFPQIAKMWHPTLNGKLKPSLVNYGSDKRVWWKCPKCGNEYNKVVSYMTHHQLGCLCCSGKKPTINLDLSYSDDDFIQIDDNYYSLTLDGKTIIVTDAQKYKLLNCL